MKNGGSAVLVEKKKRKKEKIRKDDRNSFCSGKGEVRQIPHVDYVRLARPRSEIVQTTMSAERDELMAELLKIRDIRAISRDIRRSDV